MSTTTSTTPHHPLGLDVGGTNLRAAVWDGRRLHDLAHRPTPGSVDDLAAVIRELCDDAREHADPDALGVGLPGVVAGTTAAWIPNLPFLDGVDLADVSPLPVTAHNDADLALLGEAWRGAARDVDDVVLLTVGTGVGGSVMAGGRLLRGANAAAGAFGWTVLDLDDPGDPDRGHLERTASGTALGRRARHHGLTPEQLVDRARAGDDIADAEVAAVARALGAALAGAASLLDPALILIGGGLSDALDLLRPGIEAALNRWAAPPSRATPVRAAILGDRAGVVGAVRCTLVDREVWL